MAEHTKELLAHSICEKIKPFVEGNHTLCREIADGVAETALEALLSTAPEMDSCKPMDNALKCYEWRLGLERRKSN